MSKYALNLSADNRILSATFAKYATVNAVKVDALPDGDISDYLYVGGQYVYSPIPTLEVVPVPTLDERVKELETQISIQDESLIQLFEMMEGA